MYHAIGLILNLHTAWPVLQGVSGRGRPLLPAPPDCGQNDHDRGICRRAKVPNSGVGRAFPTINRGQSSSGAGSRSCHAGQGKRQVGQGDQVGMICDNPQARQSELLIVVTPELLGNEPPAGDETIPRTPVDRRR